MVAEPSTTAPPSGRLCEKQFEESEKIKIAKKAIL
jgi:hypothetical protein